MCRFPYTLLLLALAVCSGVAQDSPLRAEDPVIHFDLPPLVAARAVSQGEHHRHLVAIELKLSSMITTTDVPRIDQWLVRCQPRDKSLSINDYAPRTEVASDLQGPIQVKKTDEKSDSLGLSLNGSYSSVARGSAGADRGQKQTDTLQFERIAPVQTVTASGTINRGRGVYFKLRWTAQQVLEGEKSFHLTFQVPENWRGSLIDVSVIAQAEHRPFPGWDNKDKTIGSAHFVVATYREGDIEAARLARQMADAEYALRSTTREHAKNPSLSLPSVLRQVATKLEITSQQMKASWVQRLLIGDADPYLDKEIRELPMPMRIAALDYCDTREEFFSLAGSMRRPNDSPRHVVAKPPQ